MPHVSARMCKREIFVTGEHDCVSVSLARLVHGQRCEKASALDRAYRSLKSSSPGSNVTSRRAPVVSTYTYKCNQHDIYRLTTLSLYHASAFPSTKKKLARAPRRCKILIYKYINIYTLVHILTHTRGLVKRWGDARRELFQGILEDAPNDCLRTIIILAYISGEDAGCWMHNKYETINPVLANAACASSA